MMATLDQWEQWLERCAIARCDAQAAAGLRVFGADRFRHAVVRSGRFDEVRGFLPADDQCFSLFEIRCCTPSPRLGKSYKRWLSERAGRGASRLKLIESGASLLVRDTAREFLRCEVPRSGQQALDVVVAGTDGLSVIDLLPSPPDIPPDDVAEWADALAARLRWELEPRELLLIRARTAGRGFADAEMLAQAGIGRSMAWKIWRGVYRKMAARCEMLLPTSGRSECLAVCLAAAERLAVSA